MNNRISPRFVFLSLLFSSTILLAETDNFNKPNNHNEPFQQANGSAPATAIFAGGCFWCIEADFEKLTGVSEVVSGYTGGSADTADYKTVSGTETGHFEAVKVSYDPAQVSYSELLEYFWKQIDPTDPSGQFCDKGSSYKSAVFYANEEQLEIATNSLTALRSNKPFEADIVTPILPAAPFYLAEEYHQDYYLKNPWRYKYYRSGCGRDQRITELWGK
jgi:peptide-methionine (S)-S-oxide reductase